MLAALGAVLIVVALFATPSWAPFFAAVALAAFALAANGLRHAFSASSNTGLKAFAYLGGGAAVVGMIVFAGRAEVTSGQLTLALHTLLNGLQFGIFLFLVAAGLTLVLGIMNFVNLAHGSLFMFGAYFAAYFYSEIFESFYIALLFALPSILLLGFVLERTVVRWLYARDHMAHVLVTFGLILFSNQFVVKVFGTDSLPLQRPELLTGNTPLFGAPYPLYRLAIIGSGLTV
ncbi:MAG: branched-chain amino acid ABC transporter permease, partial [Alphaproteobacteria bacterium]